MADSEVVLSFVWGEGLNEIGVSLLTGRNDVCLPPTTYLSLQEAPLTSSGYYQGRELIQASGKFMIMEKMFKRLREQGHRILVFSQVRVQRGFREDFLNIMC